MKSAKFTEQTVTHITHHTPKLMTFSITRPEDYRFSAGQFSRLGFHDGEGFIWRAYSIVSAEYADDLQYVAVMIEGGSMSAKFEQMQEGDTILLDKTVTGFLLPERFVGGEDLWLLSTGSGIAPFLSQLQQPSLWEHFSKIILVHSVSYSNELIFSPTIHNLVNHPLVGEYARTKLCYLSVTTRENSSGGLHTRIPDLLKNQSLIKASGTQYTPENSRFMICGNPSMVEDTFRTLLSMGFAMHRNRAPGQIIMENGF